MSNSAVFSNIKNSQYVYTVFFFGGGGSVLVFSIFPLITKT